jgi:hypothetical protein
MGFVADPRGSLLGYDAYGLLMGCLDRVGSGR